MYSFRLFRSWLWLAGTTLLLALGLAACKKDNPSPPTTGKIVGTVAPAEAVSSVTAADPNGGTVSVTPNSDSGDFSFANLEPSTYTLHFTTIPGFVAPADRSVSLAAGETNSVGTIRCGSFVPGALDGTCSPANGLSGIRVTAAGAQGGPSVQPDANGYFRVGNLAPGTYTVSFTAAMGYLAPSPRSLSVTANATASLGTLTIIPAGPSNTALRGTLSWYEGGIGHTYTSTSLAGTMSLYNGAPTDFSLTATSLSGTTADILDLDSQCRSVGPYLMSYMTANKATYLRSYGGVPGILYATRNQASPAGTVTVTAIDPIARTVSGTFGFTAAEPANQWRVTVSNGTFSLSY